MSLKLPDSIYSTQDLNQLLLEIRQYARWHVQSAIRQQADAELPPEPDISTNTRSLIQEWHGEKSPGVKSLDSLLAALEDFKEYAPVMTITLAAPPGPKLKARLTQWCRQNLYENALVDFKFDSSLLGGMVVRWGSHIYDWSFRQRILQEKHRFVEVLRNV